MYEQLYDMSGCAIMQTGNAPQARAEGIEIARKRVSPEGMWKRRRADRASSYGRGSQRIRWL